MGNTRKRGHGYRDVNHVLVRGQLCELNARRSLTCPSFCITDLDALLSDGSQYPIIQVLFNATSSYAGTIILGSILLVLLFFSTVTTVASASRQTWAFSRDCVSTLTHHSQSNTDRNQGFPFSEWIRYVPPAWEIPLNAVSPPTTPPPPIPLTTATTAPSLPRRLPNPQRNQLRLLHRPRRRPQRLYAALIFSYIISVGCVRLKRLRGEALLPRRWSLGKWGAPLNDITLAFLLVAFVFSFFPTSPAVGNPVWASQFNWYVLSVTLFRYIFDS